MTQPPHTDYMGPTVTVDNGTVHVEPSNADFGPQPSGVATDFTKEPPKGNPKPRKAFGNRLGQNKRATKETGPVPALTKADQDKIAGLYLMFGTAIKPFKPRVGNALVDIAEEAAAAWVDLARENAVVRKWIRAMLEGGAAGKLILVHLPLVLALAPERMLPPFLRASGDENDPAVAGESLTNVFSMFGGFNGEQP